MGLLSEADYLACWAYPLGNGIIGSIISGVIRALVLLGIIGLVKRCNSLQMKRKWLGVNPYHFFCLQYS
ncbi:MAG: hypothetical protein QMB24_11400 [Spirosomataceae bacterium]